MTKRQKYRLQHTLTRTGGFRRSPGGCRDELLPPLLAISPLCGQQNSFGRAIHLHAVTSTQVSLQGVSRLAEPFPTLQVFFLINYGICRYYFEKICPIDCNHHPRRCNGKNIKTINADLDFIRAISETASRAPLLPEHLNSSEAP